MLLLGVVFRFAVVYVPAALGVAYLLRWFGWETAGLVGLLVELGLLFAAVAWARQPFEAITGGTAAEAQKAFLIIALWAVAAGTRAVIVLADASRQAAEHTGRAFLDEWTVPAILCAIAIVPLFAMGTRHERATSNDAGQSVGAQRERGSATARIILFLVALIFGFWAAREFFGGGGVSALTVVAGLFSLGFAGMSIFLSDRAIGTLGRPVNELGEDEDK